MLPQTRRPPHSPELELAEDLVRLLAERAKGERPRVFMTAVVHAAAAVVMTMAPAGKKAAALMTGAEIFMKASEREAGLGGRPN